MFSTRPMQFLPAVLTRAAVPHDTMERNDQVKLLSFSYDSCLASHTLVVVNQCLSAEELELKCSFELMFSARADHELWFIIFRGNVAHLCLVTFER